MVGYVTGQFKVKEDHMVKYLNLVKDVMGIFENYVVAIT